MAAEAFLYDKVERLSQVNWHDVGTHAALLLYRREGLSFARRRAARQTGDISSLKQEKMASQRI